MPSLSPGLLAITIAITPQLLQAETVTRRVELDGIKHIHLLGDFNLSVTQGSNNYVEVTAEAEVVNRIEAKVQGSKLALGREKTSHWSLFDWDDEVPADINASFVVQLAELRSINNMGPGNVDVKNINTDHDLSFSNMGPGRFDIQNIQAEDIELDNFGPGRFQLSDIVADKIEESTFGIGKSQYTNLRVEDFELNSFGVSGTTISGNSEIEKLEVNINGAGELDADDVEVKEADIEINGAGIVYINVREKLEAKISGNGKIYYRGSPEIDQSIRGGGQLSPLK